MTLQLLIGAALASILGYCLGMALLTHQRLIDSYKETIESYKNIEKSADKLIDILEQQIDQLKSMLEPIADLSALSPESAAFMKDYLAKRYKKQE